MVRPAIPPPMTPIRRGDSPPFELKDDQEEEDEDCGGEEVDMMKISDDDLYF